jgi:hypothetical protein
MAERTYTITLRLDVADRLAEDDMPGDLVLLEEFVQEHLAGEILGMALVPAEPA